MKKFIVNLLTEADGRTWDLFRVSFSAAFLGFLGFSSWSVYQTGTFDPVAYGTGFAALFAAGGAGVGLKSKLEGPATDIPVEGK